MVIQTHALQGTLGPCHGPTFIMNIGSHKCHMITEYYRSAATRRCIYTKSLIVSLLFLCWADGVIHRLYPLWSQYTTHHDQDFWRYQIRKLSLLILLSFTMNQYYTSYRIQPWAKVIQRGRNIRGVNAPVLNIEREPSHGCH